MLTKEDIIITIRTVRRGIPFPVFPCENGDDCEEDEEGEEPDAEEQSLSDEPEEIEVMQTGRLICTSHRAELVYEESELTGMEGAVTKIGFDLADPGFVTLIRGGSVNTALVFEEEKRHISVYTTPFSSMEVCVQALAVRNALLTNGTLYLDYLIEIHGARTERCKMTLSIRKAEE